MIAFCRQRGKRYRTDVLTIKKATACFNCSKFGALVFAERQEEALCVPNKLGDNILNSPPSDIKKVDADIKNRSTIKPTLSLGSPNKILFSKNIKRYSFSLVAKVFVLVLFGSLVPLRGRYMFFKRKILVKNITQ